MKYKQEHKTVNSVLHVRVAVNTNGHLRDIKENYCNAKSNKIHCFSQSSIQDLTDGGYQIQIHQHHCPSKFVNLSSSPRIPDLSSRSLLLVGESWQKLESLSFASQHEGDLRGRMVKHLREGTEKKCPKFNAPTCTRSRSAFNQIGTQFYTQSTWRERSVCQVS